ncbi:MULTISPECIES: recombinase family protein [Frankia]|nr:MULTISPECIES: recombinase family protein [Frankia]
MGETGTGPGQARIRRQARYGRKRASREDWAGQSAAIYCRISHVADEDQTGVDRQERICREVVRRLGLRVAHVFVDNNRSAWKRDRKRKGWDRLLEVARAGEVQHVVAYHPDRLMRQPKDLEELLAISDDRDITLHGQANQRDLSDPDDRFFLRIEVAHACRSSDDTSRRMKDAMVDRANDGKPHPGKRRFGYTPDGMSIVEAEAEVARDIAARYLDGATSIQIAAVLNEQGKVTASGRPWDEFSVLAVLDSHHAAGIRVFRGEEIGQGIWPAIFDPGTWAEIRDRRSYRAAAHAATRTPARFFLLRGIVTCKRCGTRMAGTGGHVSPGYLCSRKYRTDEQKCSRRINAPALEAFVTDAAVDLLTRLDPSGQEAAATLTDADQAAIEEDNAELAELKAMWNAREIKSREYREMRRTVEERIKKVQRKTVVRPAVEVLAGLTGPHARAAWDALVEAEEYERMNAVLRFLFAAVVIDESRVPRGQFDYSRIHIDQNPL